MRLQRKSTFSYIFRNFWRLVYVVLPVAVLLAFFYNPARELSIFDALINGNITADNFLGMLTSVLTVLRLGKYWWVTLCAILLLVLTMCLLVVMISRHMRVGKMQVFPIKKALLIFPQMLLYVVVCIVANELAMLVVVGLSYLIKFIGNVYAIVSITMVLAFAIRVFLTYLFGLLLMTFPLMYSDNYRFNVAMSHSARVMSSRQMNLFGMSLLYASLRLVVLIVAYMLAPFKLHVLVYGVALTLCLMFIPSFAFKKFYDDIGGERRDLVQKLFD
ncbi:MAG: hypothetical protein J1G02_00480 [Clostridiales bacterium]|nr:hypothetical protein [Clostridiales bacterium]